MEETILSFGLIKQHNKQLCEVIIDKGVEMDDAIIDEYHACLNAKYSGPLYLLVNKKNDYTYTFSAQQRLATLPNIKAIAVVVYRRSTEIATQALQNFQREIDWNLKIFHDRHEAIDWLESQSAEEIV